MQPFPTSTATQAIDPTAQRAFAINIDASIYGNFAEIGAGQEVARWFFAVGGAAVTVAQSISAYDMTVSDAIYGKTTRYVSRERIEQMLDHEYGNDRSANGASARGGRAGRITRSNSRDWSGSMQPSLGSAEELPIHDQGRVFLVGSSPP